MLNWRLESIELIIPPSSSNTRRHAFLQRVLLPLRRERGRTRWSRISRQAELYPLVARRATLSWRITPRLRRLCCCFLPKAPITRLNAPSSLIFMRAIRGQHRALHGLPHPTTRVHAKFTRQHVRLCSPLCAIHHFSCSLYFCHRIILQTFYSS